MKIVDVSAPEGFEVSETSYAKDQVMDIIQDVLEYWNVADEAVDDFTGNYDAISVADKIVERLLVLGWRPTEED